MSTTFPDLAPDTATTSATAAELVWHDVCALADLEVQWGEAARVAGRQVALFRVDAATVLAADHRDPRTGACVLARGILGSRGGAVTVASPLHKEVYDLGTGECFTDPSLFLQPFRTRVVGGFVEVELVE